MAHAAHFPPGTPRASASEPDARTAARQRRDVIADEAKRSFLRMASHELRTPLNSILGFSEILQSELYGPLGAPQYKEYASIIHTSGARLLRLVNQVLEIARLEGGAMDFDLGPESLDHALDDVLDGLREETAPRGVEVIVLQRGRLPAVTADARGLRNLLGNLIQNAVIFSPDRAVVRVHANRVGDQVEIAVVDDGPGVDPQDIPRLLQPFEQGENALTRRSEGAGLGLPIVELLCTAMGGRLKLSSAPGQGLTARVRLPAA
ncbi:MAG: sensor histidine kinase [Phenylobacterium sp.]|uniref:sensor histidine kinase n=1 Tax=Phenylobacterium sp. TaxID=1871053 RepID=UPI0025E7A33B|nr:HAMP domain-containing sensor histidine kinase [Phenylobacterium sp.]MBA4013950.1 sensor histidine kinase [Phenylobacterium sp.]